LCASTRLCRREGEAVLGLVEEALKIADERGFQFASACALYTSMMSH